MKKQKPMLATKDGERLFGVPFVGDKPIKGWRETDNMFVDSSGFGKPGEPALTIEQFYKQIKAGLAYGVTEAGQFQVHVGVFEKTN